jgi:hypothetical protein
MRFEMDMVAHSLCEFGGGEAEREELRAYRAIHFAMLSRLEQSGKYGLFSLGEKFGTFLVVSSTGKGESELCRFCLVPERVHHREAT